MTVAPARRCAFSVLRDVETKKSYSHLTLHAALTDQTLSKDDAALCTELVHGVLLWRRLLDEWIKSLTKSSKSKVTTEAKTILRMGLYQLRFLQKIPDYAVLSDAVELAKMHQPKAAGFVNAVLRGAQRQKTYEKPLFSFDDLQGISLTEAARRLSFAEWMAHHLAKTLDEETAIEVMWGLNQKAHRALRVNRLRLSRDQLLTLFQEKGVEVHPSPIVEEGIYAPARQAAQQVIGYDTGLYSLQGESSMLVAKLLRAMPNMDILDACAAPGGKTTHIAELTGDAANIVAVDLHDHRTAMIKQQVERLGLRSIHCETMDVRHVNGQFDRILLDAPCSGLGTIARKPDLKWTMTADKVKALVLLQEQLLDACAILLRSGGVLLYTTCTMSAYENERQIGHFLEKHSEFTMLDFDEFEHAHMHYAEKAKGIGWILPQDFFGDGFFVARMQRR